VNGKTLALAKRITVVRGDITKQPDVDAIAVSIRPSLDVSGELNRAVMRAAGEKLDEFLLDNVYRPRPGDVVTLPPFNLPVRHAIFVFLPEWKGSFEREDRHLLHAYRAVMEEARRLKLAKLALPAMGTGSHACFPPRRAARLALQGIMDRMLPVFTEIRIVCSGEILFEEFSERLRKIQSGGGE
jgi:O-acetyl-ADP-ribose deacetylase (regulator of RNase III)